MKNQNLICFIPARSGSTRLKNKNLKKINKLSLIEITINQAIKSKLFKKKNIILSSDSSKILNLGKKFGITCIKRSQKKKFEDLFQVEKSISEFTQKSDLKYKGIVLFASYISS